MKQPIEGNEINLIVGSHVVSMVFKGRDGIYKTAIFHPTTKNVDGLTEIRNSAPYRTMKPNQMVNNDNNRIKHALGKFNQNYQHSKIITSQLITKEVR